MGRSGDCIGSKLSHDSASRRAWFGIAETSIFWLLVAALIGVIVVTGPILTNDGPAHLNMGEFLRRVGDPAIPMLHRVYEVNPLLTPNALAHYILAALTYVLPPLPAEQLVQILCVVSLLVATRRLLWRIDPNAAWIALFFFPVALQYLFFLGLYNFCLSVTGCIVSIHIYLAFRERPAVPTACLLTAVLLATLACQAFGWMEAIVAIGVLVSMDAASRLKDGAAFSAVVRQPAIVLLCILPGLALFILFALQGGTERQWLYTIPAWPRVAAILRGEAFAPMGRSTSIFSVLLGLMLIVMIVSGFRSAPATNAAARRLVWAMAAVPAGFFAFALIIPDQAGGGWSHVPRAKVFPYIGLALVAALFPIHATLRMIAVGLATAAATTIIGMTLWLQISPIAAVARDFDKVDRLIGPHCTLAPVLAQFKLTVGNPERLAYHPLFHLANRIELRFDRPVLFNYNARLPIYPVRFRPEVDPQRLLFKWLPFQRDTNVYEIDTEGYTEATGIVVDYVLLGDVPGPDQPGPFQTIRSVALAHYALVHRSEDGRLELFRRSGPDGCAKP